MFSILLSMHDTVNLRHHRRHHQQPCEHSFALHDLTKQQKPFHNNIEKHLTYNKTWSDWGICAKNIISSIVALSHTQPFNGPLSGTTWYQKGKTNLDFTEARDSEWQWHQLGHIQVCTPCSRQTTMPAPQDSVFYRLDALPAAQPTASKHWLKAY